MGSWHFDAHVQYSYIYKEFIEPGRRPGRFYLKLKSAKKKRIKSFPWAPRDAPGVFIYDFVKQKSFLLCSVFLLHFFQPD